MARVCQRACVPAPTTPTVTGSVAARYRAASPPIHPVRALVTRVPAMYAAGSPVAASVSAIVAFTVGNPRSTLPSWTLASFVAK